MELDMCPGDVAAVGGDLAGVVDSVGAARQQVVAASAGELPAPVAAAFDELVARASSGLSGARDDLNGAARAARATGEVVREADDASAAGLSLGSP